MATPKATSTSKRTPLYHIHQSNLSRPGRRSESGSDTVINTTQNKAADLAPAKLAHCALIDCCALARIGLRGKNATAVLNNYHYQLPTKPNQAICQDDGGLVARLSVDEYLLLGSLADRGERIARDAAVWRAESNGYYMLPREDTHAWLGLTGQHASDVMAKLCSVDLAPAVFPRGKVAQTSVAMINAIVINNSSEKMPCLYVLVDSASAWYLWQVFMDAIQEYGGEIVDIMNCINLK